jgi:hypothetical protein
MMEEQHQREAEQQGAGVQGLGGVAAAAEDASLLLAFQRQAGLSAWLQRCVKPRVEAGLSGASTTSEAVLQLLSGHQLTGECCMPGPFLCVVALGNR